MHDLLILFNEIIESTSCRKLIQKKMMVVMFFLGYFEQTILKEWGWDVRVVRVATCICETEFSNLSYLLYLELLLRLKCPLRRRHGVFQTG